MSWSARLDIAYTSAQQRTVERHTHEGPLRLLQSLYPEGESVCHNVLVHPPGGLVGGDTLDLHVHASGGAHALITTPGATRLYRSAGALAAQRTRIELVDNARLEWLPLEAIAYNQCHAENRLTLALGAQAEFMGWDITALGLPAANLPFEQGRLLQHIEVPGVWLERGCIDAADTRLMNGPLGLAGHRCLASLFFIAGAPLQRARCEQALALARACIDAHTLRYTAGVTCPSPQVMVLRVLAPLTESASHLLRQVWSVWRTHFWGLAAVTPRVWAM